MARTKPTNKSRRKFLKKTIGWAAAGTGAAGLGFATVVGVRHLQRRAAKVKAERRVQIRQAIAESGLAIAPEPWTPFVEIYNFNLSKPATKKFVGGIDRLCAKLEISPKRFFETLHYHPILPITIRQLETKKTSRTKEIAKLEAGKKSISKTAQKRIDYLNGEIARLGRIQSVVSFCLDHKAEANKAKKKGSLVKVQRVKD